jgi:hypothetical protein
MPELIAKANQAILEAQRLRREQRSLRLEANVLASRLGETIVRSHAMKGGLRQTFLDVAERLATAAAGENGQQYHATSTGEGEEAGEIACHGGEVERLLP